MTTPAMSWGKLVTTVSARELLGPGGPLQELLPGYEPRESQLQMAEAVERALRGERRLVCEAGTGTGKTLAYLVPALLSGRKVLVSTATKALQEQIFTKDLPLLDRLGLGARTALLKGMGNYLCLRRFHQLRASAEGASPERAAAIAAVERWLERTEDGDLASLPGVSEGNPVRLEIAASSEARVGPSCPHHEACFITRSRQRAEAAQVLIVNHHLFFADLALRGPQFVGGVLPDYDAVIFDEAHQIEEIATEFFGVRVSQGRVDTLLRDAGRSLEAAGADLRAVESTRVAAGHFFKEVAAMLGAENVRAPVAPDRWTRDGLATYHRLDAALEALALATENKQEALQGIARRATALRNDLDAVIEGARHRVLWGEVSARSVSLAASPIRVAPMLRSRLFEQVGPVILTSATLSTHGSFDYVRERLGLSDDLGPVDELTLLSPFDYPANALLYVASSLPDPQDPRFLHAAADHAASLIHLSGGGAFVLCTSVRAMQSFHTRLAAEPFELLLQGEAPKTALLERFRASGHAVLVATMSFWEGVDVPGDALRLVILDKIPFPVPTDPLVAARGAALQEDGGDPFSDYLVPAAAITLKQGFGRLIRSSSDRGVVALLDRRLVSRRYGPRLQQTLPPARITEWPEDVEEFFARSTPSPPDDNDIPFS
jgi:ATP-dependent DNA helicase DinG